MLHARKRRFSAQNQPWAASTSSDTDDGVRPYCCKKHLLKYDGLEKPTLKAISDTEACLFLRRSMARARRKARINWLVDSLVRACNLRCSCDRLSAISWLSCSTLKFSSA